MLEQLAEQIHQALQSSPDGLTRTQIRDLFARHQSRHRVDHALRDSLSTMAPGPRTVEHARDDRADTGAGGSPCHAARGRAPRRANEQPATTS